MKNIIRKNTSFAFLAVFSSMFLFGACGYEKSETDYVNEIEAAENEVGDPMLRGEEQLIEAADNDSINDSDQPARIDGQEGHPAPPTEEDNDYHE